MNRFTVLIDSHCHLRNDIVAPVTDRRWPPASAALARGKKEGVVGFVAVGVGETVFEARETIAMAHADPRIVAVVGVHPHDARHLTDEMFAEFESMTLDTRVAAVGEIGLDYFYEHSPKQAQKDVFARFIALAKTRKKPVVIHTRDAAADTLDVLEAENAKDVGGVIHCFSEDWAFAKRAMDWGFSISFSGMVTFPKLTALAEVAKQVPLDRLLVETDSPYLAPVPFRGKKNEPAYVVYTAKFLAEIRGESFDDFCANTTQNARTAFAGLPG